jgi:hypothetical protein
VSGGSAVGRGVRVGWDEFCMDGGDCTLSGVSGLEVPPLHLLHLRTPHPCSSTIQ